PSSEPMIPAAHAGRIQGLAGLDTAAVWRPHNVLLSNLRPNGLGAHQTGSGPGGALTPSDILTAYNLNGLSVNGAGQSIALFELDGYTASDITAYEDHYSLPHVPLQNVLVDKFTGKAGSGAGEVTL